MYAAVSVSIERTYFTHSHWKCALLWNVLVVNMDSVKQIYTAANSGVSTIGGVSPAAF